jgi:hypothetical protein
MLDYRFPHEHELFLPTPYTDVAREATAKRNREEARIWAQAATFILRAFIIASILLVAAHSGLSRVEAQFQSDMRR